MDSAELGTYHHGKAVPNCTHALFAPKPLRNPRSRVSNTRNYQLNTKEETKMFSKSQKMIVRCLLAAIVISVSVHLINQQPPSMSIQVRNDPTNRPIVVESPTTEDGEETQSVKTKKISNGCEPRRRKIVWGDTLSGIAVEELGRWDVTALVLFVLLNTQIEDPDVILAGDTLLIPCKEDLEKYLKLDDDETKTARSLEFTESAHCLLVPRDECSVVETENLGPQIEIRKESTTGQTQQRPLRTFSHESAVSMFWKPRTQ